MSSKASTTQRLGFGPEIEAKTVAEHLDGIDERVRQLRSREAGKFLRQGRRSLSQAVRRATEWFRQRREEHVTFRELAALDDRMLRDLGLSRGELHYVARQAAATPGAIDRPVFDSRELKLESVRLVNCETLERQQSRAA